jgi:hypothetical protein
MKNLFSAKRSAIIAGFFLILSCIGSAHYPGNILYFCFFNAVWLMLLYFVLSRPVHYVYFFSVCMLFLGFFLKGNFHFIFQTNFIEPVGAWSLGQSPLLWDRVLLASSLAPLAILLAGFATQWMQGSLLKSASSPFSPSARIEKNNGVPLWYREHRSLAWGIVAAISISTNVLNVLGVLRVTALPEKWILPFHLNVLIIWLMMVVVCSFLASFVGWDQTWQKDKNSKMYYLIILLALITSITTLSRSVFLFATLPYFLVFMRNYSAKESVKLLFNNKVLVGSYLLAFFLSLILVSGLRLYLYVPQSAFVSQPQHLVAAPHESKIPQPTHKSLSIAPVAEQPKSFANMLTTYRNMPLHQALIDQMRQLQPLLVERWIGMEGVMATTAYPSGGWDLFIQGIRQKPIADDVGIYSTKVLNLTQTMECLKFASLPGLIGFLDYSHSMSVVFFGAFIAFFVLNLIELIALLYVKNQYFVAQFGLLVAYFCVSGFNIPYLSFVQLVENVMVIFLFLIMEKSYVVLHRRSHSLGGKIL